MALIVCAECKKEISSFANSCPFCGCPSEYQQGRQCNNNDVSNGIKTDDYEPTLNHYDEWNNVLNLVKQKRGPDAQCEIEKLVGKNKYVMKILLQMIRTSDIPTDMIIEFFPEQKNTRLGSNKIHNIHMISCECCSRPISTKAETCPHCGNPTGVHVCPKCGSTNTHVIVGVDKAISVALWGRFAANEVMSKYACYDCKHKW